MSIVIGVIVVITFFYFYLIAERSLQALSPSVTPLMPQFMKCLVQSLVSINR
ncbi:hypothetical protein [Nostoc sp.]|uniref:hypothetical protein n=1 Tax=Nostoc sp. TaxID=1180 RepID=UPI002FFA2786